MKRALLVRMDKIGDLVLSLPVDQSTHLKDYRCDWLISQGLEFVPRHSRPARTFLSWPRELSGLAIARRLLSHVRWLKSQNYALVVVFYAPWWVGLCLWLAKIPVRVGRLSQWHSFIFFNRGVRQSRSQSALHESDYNWDLLERGLSGPQAKDRDTTKTGSRPWLELAAPPAPMDLVATLPPQYVVVHPGMAGSALNWPARRYAELLTELLQSTPVVVTGSKIDLPILGAIQGLMASTTKAPNQPLLWLQEKLTAESLLVVLTRAKAVIAPSTGVLHLAASLGRPSLGLYSPIRAHHPNRWGPRGPKTKVLLPTDLILENTNSNPNVMEGLSVQSVMEVLKEWGILK